MEKIGSVCVRVDPRALESLGADLVTNDMVAMVELVKNSYDACASEVTVAFGHGNSSITITDNGKGMSQDIIENAWAVVATPYRLSNPTEKFNNIERTATGNKGLGRLSAARLGEKLEIITKQEGGPALLFRVIWKDLYSSQNLANGAFDLFDVSSDNLIQGHGTILKIEGLKSEWGASKIQDLKSELSRLINPFKGKLPDFDIAIKNEDREIDVFNWQDDEEKIKLNDFIDDPPYLFKGAVNAEKSVSYLFSYYKDYFNHEKREKKEINGAVSWEEITTAAKRDGMAVHDEVPCGTFSFEIRIWELSSDYLDEIASKYRIKARSIREIISRHKGMSVYRDGVLVMPKSEASLDWLGMDKRRISQIGRRLSTSQIIGIICITSKENPNIGDTTDRETFKTTPEFENFYAICNCGIVRQMQNLRLAHKPDDKEVRSTFKSLFEDVSPKKLEQKMDEIEKNGGTIKDAKEAVANYSSSFSGKIDSLREKMEYYAQLASAGTFSRLVIHEIRNAINPIQRYSSYTKEAYSPFSEKIEVSYNQCINSTQRLVDLSDTFMPLCNKKFKNENFFCDVKSQIEYSIRLIKDNLKGKNIEFDTSLVEAANVLLHPGEFQTILLNLLENSVYWLGRKYRSEGGEIIISTTPNDGYLLINVSDNGPGVDPTMKDRIFEPGVTAKLDGFGMGLVVVNEIVTSHGGYLKNVQPGDVGGATFEFTLPIAKGSEK